MLCWEYALYMIVFYLTTFLFWEFLIGSDRRATAISMRKLNRRFTVPDDLCYLDWIPRVVVIPRYMQNTQV